MTTVTDTCIDQIIEHVSPTIHHIAETLWRLAELSHQEEHSARLLMEILQEQGFTIVSTGTAGVPTAFLAEYGTGAPRLGLLAEYDALPGLGNEPVASRQPRTDQVTSGHACGHNLLGAGCIGAALTLKALMERERLAGTIRVYGCAAEETEGAKVYMARAGLFQDLDAALHWHPDQQAQVVNCRSLAVDQLFVEFFGQAAHATQAPWQGRSAAHAAALCMHALTLMREHLEPTARVHAVIEHEGTTPNVVSDYARLHLFVRGRDRPQVADCTAWIKQIVQAVSLATQTQSQVLVYMGYADLVPNSPLASRMYQHLTRLGVPVYTSEEQEFARVLQEQLGVEPRGMCQHLPLLGDEERVLPVSTDVGDVSWQTPTIGCSMPTLPLGIATHTWAATACHGMSLGVKGALAAAKALSMMGYDLLTDAPLRRAARADFLRRVARQPYVSPLPPEMTAPLGAARAQGRQFSEGHMQQRPLGSNKGIGGDHNGA